MMPVMLRSTLPVLLAPGALRVKLPVPLLNTTEGSSGEVGGGEVGEQLVGQVEVVDNGWQFDGARLPDVRFVVNVLTLSVLLVM